MRTTGSDAGAEWYLKSYDYVLRENLNTNYKHIVDFIITKVKEI